MPTIRNSSLPRSAAWAALGVALVCVFALSGCGSSSAPTPPVSTGAAASTPTPTSSPSGAGHRAPSPTPSTETQDVFSLSVGDCVNGTAAGEVTDVPTVECSVPHDLEVFYDFDLTGDSYPGDSVISDAAKAGCQAQFRAFVGIDYSASALDFTEYTPTEQSWANGDRTVSCVIGDPNGKTTGTLAGAAR